MHAESSVRQRDARMRHASMRQKRPRMPLAACEGMSSAHHAKQKGGNKELRRLLGWVPPRAGRKGKILNSTHRVSAGAAESAANTLPSVRPSFRCAGSCLSLSLLVSCVCVGVCVCVWA